MKMNKNIIVTTIKILMGLVILLGVLSFIYPKVYLPIGGWIYGISKSNSIEHKGYKIELSKGWYFDSDFNDSSVVIAQYPQSLVDDKFLNIGGTIRYKHQIPERLSKVKTNKFNFKCTKSIRPNLPDRYLCAHKNKPFIISIYNLSPEAKVDESMENIMENLMKNTKIEKL